MKFLKNKKAIKSTKIKLTKSQGIENLQNYLWIVCPEKIQIILHIHTVWSVFTKLSMG